MQTGGIIIGALDRLRGVGAGNIYMPVHDVPSRTHLLMTHYGRPCTPQAKNSERIMAKQSRLAGFLGLERYQDAETTPEESPQAVQADTRKEANRAGCYSAEDR